MRCRKAKELAIAAAAFSRNRRWFWKVDVSHRSPFQGFDDPSGFARRRARLRLVIACPGPVDLWFTLRSPQSTIVSVSGNIAAEEGVPLMAGSPSRAAGKNTRNLFNGENV
jgi:hypothetical protein